MDVFELWCWRILLRVHWIFKDIKPINPRGNQPWIFVRRTVGFQKVLELKWKLQYYGYLKQRANPLEKTLLLWKIEGKRKRGWQRMRWLDNIKDSLDMNLSKLQEITEQRMWRATVHGVAKSRILLSHWTTTIIISTNG